MNDAPIADMSDDLLNIAPFVTTLQSFIEASKTPFAISLRGEWGSGKTSVFNILEKNLQAKNYTTITFNTWQYSQLGDEQYIGLVFSKYILQTVKYTSQFPQYILEIIENLIKMFDSLLKVVDDKTPLKFLPTVLEMLFSRNENIDKDYFKLTKLKESLKKVLSQGEKPFVIFIDDMDRVDVAVAMRILNVIKIFFDIENCIFILALDYEAFSKKVGKTSIHADYLEKIIQLNISIPVNFYNITKFIETYCDFQSRIAHWETKEEDLRLLPYVNLVENSIGNNPRALKRLACKHIFYGDFYKNYYGRDALHSYESQALFALLCLKEKYPDIYFEVTVRKTYNFDFVKQLMTVLYAKITEQEIETNDIYNAIILASTNNEYEKIVSLYNFISSFSESITIYIDNKKKLRLAEIEMFERMSNLISDKKLLSYSDKHTHHISLPLDECDDDFIDALNTMCPITNKYSKIYKNISSDTLSLCFKYNVGPCSFTFAIEKNSDGIRAYLADADNKTGAYRTFIYKWVKEKCTGVPACYYNALDEKFIVFDCVRYPEFMEKDYAGSKEDYSKATFSFLMVNFLNDLNRLDVANTYQIKFLDELYADITKIVERVFNENDWTIICPCFSDMLSRFSRINIHKKSWNNKIFISFESQDYFFTNIIMGVRKKERCLPFRDNYEEEVYSKICLGAEREDYKIKKSEFWIAYNSISPKDFTKKTYTEILDITVNNDSKRKVLQSIRANFQFYKNFVEDFDELPMKALY